MPLDIDLLPTTRSLIDLSSHSSGDFGLEDYELTFILDDIILVEYVDISSDGDSITRNGLFVPTNALTKAWRKARVILIGPNVKHAKKGDIVVFPNNLGVTVSNMDIEGYGKIKKGVFLNESRIFGICKLKHESTEINPG
jgi:cellobiose-specific phosphotransferase system component IIB